MPLTRWLSATCLVGLLLLVPHTATAAPETPTPSTPPTETQVSPTPEVRAVVMKITAWADRSAVNGEVITIGGQLLRDGKGHPGVGIVVHDRAGEVNDSYTVTSGDGTFSTRYAVPEDQPDGWLSLTLSNEGTDPASTKLNVDIRHTEVPTQEATPEAAEAEAAYAVTTPPAPSPTPTPPSPSPTQSADRASAGVGEQSSPLGVWTWFIAALGGVAVVGTGATAALMVRDRRNRDEDFDFVDDEDER